MRQIGAISSQLRAGGLTVTHPPKGHGCVFARKAAKQKPPEGASQFKPDDFGSGGHPCWQCPRGRDAASPCATVATFASAAICRSARASSAICTARSFCMITDTASCRRSSDLLRWRAMQDGDDRARLVGILFQPIEGFSRSFKLIFSRALLYGIR